MNTKWDDTSWQKEFWEMKFHSPDDVKLLTQGVKRQIGVWRLGVLKEEYNRRFHLKNIIEESRVSFG